MSRSCKECTHNNPDFIDEVCLDCYWPEFTEEPSNFEPKPVTNADRIRSMTDEELAEWINKHDCHTNLYGYDHKEAIYDWLRQEAKEHKI